MHFIGGSMSYRQKNLALPLAILAAFSSTGTEAAAQATQKPADTTAIDALNARLERLEKYLGAQEADDAEANPEQSEQVATLEQRLLILERKLELQQEESSAKASSTPVVTLNEKGLSAKSADGNFEIKLKGLVQADQRLFFGDDEIPQNDSFLFRRIRPTIEGSFGSLIGFRLTPEFAGDSATIVDAYVDVKFDPAYTLRVGKLKGPIGLERLQSGGATALIERAFPTELAPNREIGAQLQGELAGGRVNYAIGVFNGAPDGRDDATSDVDDNFEYAGRVFFEPWKNAANALSGLGFGIAASIGDKEGAGNNFLPRYRTPGQNIFFNYRNTVLANGEHFRLSPQAYYYRNAFGLQAEYIQSRQALELAGNPASNTELSNSAWQVTGSWVLTGEDAGYRGVLKPNAPFTSGGEGWGAFELVARYGELDIDDDAFPLYANLSTAASQATAWGIGLNWYLNSNLKLAFNHTHTQFEGGAVGSDREDEKTFFSRIQLSF